VSFHVLLADWQVWLTGNLSLPILALLAPDMCFLKISKVSSSGSLYSVWTENKNRLPVKKKELSMGDAGMYANAIDV